MSLKDKFFAIKGELRAEEYPMPSSNGHADVLHVREISAQEWLDIKVRSLHHRQAINGPDLWYEARIMAHSVTDKDGNLVFDPHDDECLRQLANEPARVFDPLMEVVNRVNRTGDDQHEQLKKTSETAQSSASSTGSPETPAG